MFFDSGEFEKSQAIHTLDGYMFFDSGDFQLRKQLNKLEFHSQTYKLTSSQLTHTQRNIDFLSNYWVNLDTTLGDSSPTLFNYVQLCSTMFNFVQLCSTLFNFVQLCSTLFNFVCSTLFAQLCSKTLGSLIPFKESILRGRRSFPCSSSQNQ